MKIDKYKYPKIFSRITYLKYAMIKQIIQDDMNQENC